MSGDPLHRDAVRVLDEYAAGPATSKDQRSLAQAYLGFLAARPDAMRRSCVPGHLTASTILLSADRSRVLLTLHRRLGRWLQVGGHCEPRDGSLLDAARREAIEESGVGGLIFDPSPVLLDTHPLTCSLGVPTRHFDVQFRAFVPAEAVPSISDESADLAFFPVSELPAPTDDSVRALVRAALARP